MFDIILALSISVVFVSIMAGASIGARRMYEHSRDRSELLSLYSAHAPEFEGMMPYETRSKTYEMGTTSGTIRIDARARWYGNDRVETVIDVYRGNVLVNLAAVRAYPSGLLAAYAGTPLCSADLTSGEMVGSYRYFHPVSRNIQAQITPITLPIDPLLPLTDIEVRGNIAYVSANSAVASVPDLYIFDIADPSQASVLSSLSTGPGISAIALAGDRVFAAADSTAAQLHVIKIEGLNSLYLSKKYQLPLPEASTSPPVGSAIFYDDSRVYLGTSKWDGHELSIIDVTNPESPMKLSGYKTGSKVNALFARADTLYVGASDQEQFRVFDVRDPGVPILMRVFSPSGWERQEGKAVDSFEDRLSLGRTSGGFNIANDKEIFSGPATSSAQYAVDIPGGVYGIVSDRDHIFLATRTPDRELTIFDRSPSPSSASYHSLPVQPQGMTCDNDRLFILAKTAPVIYEIRFYSD